MTKLLDFSWARPGAAAIKKAGYAGVLRYVSSTTGKNLSSSELRDYQDNGLYVGIVFEDGARNALMGFEQGIIDAKKALSLCNSLGFVNMPIYFAVDFDTTPEQQTEIDQYFKGINSIIGVSRTGAYGSYYIMLRCKASGFVSWFWQTLAWSGGQVADFIHIYQNGQSAFGGGADVDEAKQDNWGQYIPEATPQIQEVVSTPETPPILPPETLVIPEVVPVTQSTPEISPQQEITPEVVPSTLEPIETPTAAITPQVTLPTDQQTALNSLEQSLTPWWEKLLNFILSWIK